MNKTNKAILLVGILLCVIGFTSIVYAGTLAQRLSGKILLQVEQNGEAWYIYPNNQQRYYLGRPADAFNIMRELGLGISDKDLNQIPISPNSLSSSQDTQPYTSTTNQSSSEKGWKEVAKFTGSSSKTTDTFTITGEKFRANYSNTIKENSIITMFQVFAKNNPDDIFDSCLIANNDESGSDTTYCHQKGVYYLDITALDSKGWSIVIEEYK